MKNLIKLLLVGLFFVSCSSGKVESSSDSSKVNNSTVVKNNIDNSSRDFEKPTEFSDPVFMYGTDFLGFFKSLRKIGDIDNLIKFTSKESIDKFGEDKLRDIYENSFNNMSDSRLTKLDELDENHFTMHYLNSQYATKKVFELNVVRENDSIKLIFEDKYPF